MSHFIAGTRSGRVMSRTVVVVTVLVLLLLVQTGLAQGNNGPLDFGNNFFVTGDYVVAGAYGMTKTSGGYATGIITVPDTNPGITDVNGIPCLLILVANCKVPAGAQIVAALLYWETVEKTGVQPGQPGSGQNGFFRPLIPFGPPSGSAITGTPLGVNNTVSFSSGGCSGTSTGKVVRTYRADVRGLLPQDFATGLPLPNVAYEVRLPSSGSSTPLTLGATLVLIYRVLSPDLPLRSVVIYDGSFGNSQAQPLSQTLQGPYDALKLVTRVTHIVGSGQSNKYQTASLGSTQLAPLYSPFLPLFPGWYSNWDNPTWTLTGKFNPLANGDASVKTVVAPTNSNAGCLTWAAVILSTTVENTDQDGLLDSWKRAGGYCDVGSFLAANPANPASCTSPDPAWVSLPNVGQPGSGKDMFVQLDYMTSPFENLDPRQYVDPLDGKSGIDKVVDAYAKKGIDLHVVPGNVITEPICTDNTNNPVCPYPNQSGVVGWKGGLVLLKNQTIGKGNNICQKDQNGNYPANSGCPGIPVFQRGKKDSYHYTLFAHSVGLPQWTLVSGTLTSVTQVNNTVTFTTSTPHKLDDAKEPNNLSDGIFSKDAQCPQYGRVSVNFALSNPNPSTGISHLNGTFCVGIPLKNGKPDPNSFTITVPGPKLLWVYTALTDPNLSVTAGRAGTFSGFSDVGGEDSLFGLGSWGSDAQSWQVNAGTFMHELGHSVGLTHGGFSYALFPRVKDPYAQNYFPSVEPNCKSNYQSVMSYMFQVDLLDGGINPDTKQPITVVDYSQESLAPLSEKSGVSLNSLSSLLNPTYSTWFYAPYLGVGQVAGAHCDGTAITDNSQMVLTPVSLSGLASVAGQDINYDGKISATLKGHTDWTGAVDPATGLTTTPGIDLRQISAAGTLSATGAAGVQGLGGGGGVQGLGGGGGVQGLGGGGGVQGLGGGGGVQPLGGGGGVQGLGGGGGIQGVGGGGGIPDLSRKLANSATRPPRYPVLGNPDPNINLPAEGNSKRTITISWTKPSFGNIGAYSIYRANKLNPTLSDFQWVAAVLGSQLFYSEFQPCNTPNGYKYYVTASLAGTFTPPVTATNKGQESGPSDFVGGTDLTGCYTVMNFSSPASAVHGSVVPITWTLTDDFHNTGDVVNRKQAVSKLVAIGPASTDGCAHVTPSARTNLVSDGGAVSGGTSNLAVTNGQFTFSWDTDQPPFCAGSYTFELTLDSGQVFTTGSALQLSIDIEDTNSTPHIVTFSLPQGTVGTAYSHTIQKDGGTAPFTWSYSNGSLPSNINLNSGTGTLAGTTCVAGTYNFTAAVTDAKSNSGLQGLQLVINKANTTTSVASDTNPSVFQQPVTFTVTVPSQGGCTPTGSVALFDGATAISGALPLTNGVASFQTYALSVGVHSITATYSGDTNFTTSTSPALSQMVNKASTAITFNSVTPAQPFVGQPVAVAYTFGVQPPGAGTPTIPTGTVTITATGQSATDVSSCSAALALGGCTLSPAPTAAGVKTVSIAYSGDNNFLASAANGSNYTVYQLVFTTQPSNTVAGSTITPPVTLAAQDGSGNTLPTFTGSISIAIGTNPSSGMISGTTPQNAVSGVATFSDLSIDKQGTGYTLVASTGTPASTATSNPFNVDGLIYYDDQSGNFGKLDLTTGVVTEIGHGSVQGNTGMDLTPGGDVYEYNISNQLFKVNTSTGAATQVGSGTTGSVPDPGFMTTGGLTTGAYYAIDMVNGSLYSINLQDGTTMLVGATGIPNIGPSCGYNTSLSGSATKLYYTVAYGGAHCGSPHTDILYVIDPANAAATMTVGPTSITGFVGSAYVGGKLYGFTSEPKEYVIDVATGAATFVTNTTTTVFGGGSVF